jgi:hypothetical protein
MFLGLIQPIVRTRLCAGWITGVVACGGGWPSVESEAAKASLLAGTARGTIGVAA